MDGTKHKNFYLTTTLPYVNADPHIGFALEMVQADTIARFHASRGDIVVFNTGTDEHGLKIYRKAVEEGMDPQAYADEYARRFDRLKKALDVSYTHFIRTTDPHHKAAAQEFWRRCRAAGDIEQRDYAVQYCVGCELEKTDSELVDGRCPIHPNIAIELHDEKNYFFKFSKYQKPLLDFYETHPDFVLPSFRFNEIKRFVADGLRDFSISRLKAKLPWGVEVPDDPDHVMYVWFDALVNYISTLGWPENETNLRAFWPGMQIAGKDNLRQQSAMWQAMLMSAGLPPSRQILIHGFVTVDGEKMSKSLGNVIDPFALVEKYGTDAVRYYLLREIPSGEDGDFSYEKFEARYNGDLANGLGNLVARVAKLGEGISPISFEKSDINEVVLSHLNMVREAHEDMITNFKLNDALGNIWTLVGVADKYINDQKPWAVKSDTAALGRIIGNAAVYIDAISDLLAPFLPQTVTKIREQVSVGERTITIKKGDNLFPRLS
jgi:methionyl-tRNA synthetase